MRNTDGSSLSYEVQNTRGCALGGEQDTSLVLGLSLPLQYCGYPPKRRKLSVTAQRNMLEPARPRSNPTHVLQIAVRRENTALRVSPTVDGERFAFVSTASTTPSGPLSSSLAVPLFSTCDRQDSCRGVVTIESTCAMPCWAYRKLHHVSCIITCT